MTPNAAKSQSPPPSLSLAGRSSEPILCIELEPACPDRALGRGKYSVRRTTTMQGHIGATTLVRRMYSRRGYLTDASANASPVENSVTLEARSAQQLVGTLTVRLDSSEGLLADGLYEKEINAYRSMGRKASEVSKLAIDPEYGSKELLASLFQLAYLYLHVAYRAVDTFIEVNPRHAGFYKRMLGFREIGKMRTCPRVNAPAVLLHIELEYMKMQIAAHGGRGSGSRERSLYPYFASCGTEDWIDRILNMTAPNS